MVFSPRGASGSRCVAVNHPPLQRRRARRGQIDTAPIYFRGERDFVTLLRQRAASKRGARTRCTRSDLETNAVKLTSVWRVVRFSDNWR
jgi:hypothetical protein